MLAHRLNVRAALYIQSKQALDASLDGGAWDIIDHAQRMFTRVIGLSSIDQLKSILELTEQSTRDYALDIISDILFAHKRLEDLDVLRTSNLLVNLADARQLHLI